MTRWSSPLVLCLIALGLLARTATATIVVPDGSFVVHGSTADIKRGVDIAHDAGARWVSLSSSWESLEPQPDSYLIPGGAGTTAWNELGDQLAYAKSKGMSVELRFANAPGWASGRDPATDDPPTAANVAAYGDFLADVARRFGPYIDAYSPWNEPNLTRFWNPVNPEAYTALQKVAYTSIKAIDPSATVLSAAIVGRYAGVNSGYSFLRRAYQAGLKGYVDVIGWNGYPGGEPESSAPVEDGVPAGNTLPAQLYLRDLIDQYDPGRRVWIMEMGWSTCVSCNVSATNGATESQQADFLTRAFTYRRRYLSAITDRIFWYQLRDDGSDRSNWFDNQGVVRRDFSAKPSLAAFTALGVETPGNTIPGPETVATPVGSGNAVLPLPASAIRGALPALGTSAGGRLRIGVPTLRARRGRFTLTLRVSLRGGAVRLRVDGFRAHRWRSILTTRILRSGRLTIRFADRGYLGIRLRATVPGREGWRVGRIVRISARQSRPP